ncbi:endonuclease/exonuclease/phosphatase family metal-dependent hydrolase [Haloferula luteola]|uniref:Endonuclease/exonuclease/phosphatase family metal-dependent hydrolase n=1 Tax=Haloferula luteola TaxID=595692 RepID=A0A840V635_9BACT|nr:endonuclease/exonuclease/phosphatase family protein [Haloferula luteola]MBB5350248.1 endonuclease/exonuclease/phosphatase family metal-dependent hydrolase [Haloferula luteola]
MKSAILLFATTLAFTACRESPPPRAIIVREDGVIDLQLASFNIRREAGDDEGWRSWPQRIGRVVSAIRTLDPDILGIQEAVHFQAADLRASLPDYDFHGVGRGDGKRAGEYAAIFWKSDQFAAGERGTFWLSDFPDQPGSKTWGNTFSRCATWIRLTDLATGRPLFVLNTHWDHRHQGSREKASRLIAERIDALARPTEEVILLGDLNATEGNPAVDFLAGRGKNPWTHALTDPYAALHPREKNRRTLHFWEAHRDGWAKVDHILVSKGARFLEADILRAPTRELQPSDHYPVWAHIQFPLSSTQPPP